MANAIQFQKNPNMSGPAFEAFNMKAQAEHLTPEEWKGLRPSVSNGGTIISVPPGLRRPLARPLPRR